VRELTGNTNVNQKDLPEEKINVKLLNLQPAAPPVTQCKEVWEVAGVESLQEAVGGRALHAP